MDDQENFIKQLKLDCLRLANQIPQESAQDTVKEAKVLYDFIIKG